MILPLMFPMPRHVTSIITYRLIRQAGSIPPVPLQELRASRYYATKQQNGVFPRSLMSSVASLSHEERTTAEHRESNSHAVFIDSIDHIKYNVRLFRLKPVTREIKMSMKARSSAF